MDCPRAVELGAVAPDYVGALKADASGIYVTGVDGLRRLGMNGQDMLSMLSGSVGELILTDALVYFAVTDAVKRVPKHGGEASRVTTANVPIALASSSTHVFWAEQDEATGGYAIRRVRR